MAYKVLALVASRNLPVAFPHLVSSDTGAAGPTDCHREVTGQTLDSFWHSSAPNRHTCPIMLRMFGHRCIGRWLRATPCLPQCPYPCNLSHWATTAAHETASSCPAPAYLVRRPDPSCPPSVANANTADASSLLLEAFSSAIAPPPALHNSVARSSTPSSSTLSFHAFFVIVARSSHANQPLLCNTSPRECFRNNRETTRSSNIFSSAWG